MWKKLAFSLTPPILWRGLQRLRGESDQQNIWEGIYESRSELEDIDESYFNQEEWVDAAKKELRELLAKKRAGVLDREISGEQLMLPMLIASLLACQKKVRVLDFGGGMGVDFINCESLVKRMDKCDYYLVDTDKVTQETKKLIKRSNLKVVASLPKRLARVDVVHLDSVLQYAPDYRKLLKELVGYRPKFVLLVRLAAGKFPTFFSVQQNMPGMRMP